MDRRQRRIKRLAPRQNLPPRLLRSLESVVRSHVRFYNLSTRTVDIYWLNYEGFPIHYMTLAPKAYYDVDTYVNHPWVFVDHKTKQFLVIESCPVFYPPPPRTQIPSRKIFFINIPVYSLREMCLQSLADNVKEEAIENLELPRILIEELQKIVRK